MNNPTETPQFGPNDPSDGGRKLGEWQSRYPDSVPKWGIRFEAIYLAILLFGIPVFLAYLRLDHPKNFFGLSDGYYKIFLKYSTAWLGGTFGGTLFDIKWLYHSVARQQWHLDRRLWRLFTPHISGGLAFVIVVLISSGIFQIFDRNAVESHSLVFGVGFLVGYFSDSAIAKLMEIAYTLFGVARGQEKPKKE